MVFSHETDLTAISFYAPQVQFYATAIFVMDRLCPLRGEAEAMG